MNYWPLIGVAALALGFVLRLNPALVVVAAGFITGLAAKISPLEVLEVLGKAYTEKRFLLLFLLTLPVIGLLERHGLKEHAQRWVARLRGATMARLLIAYLLMRQLASAVGLTSLGGHPQTVRPLLAPMAEGAAQANHGDLDEDTRQRIRAMAAGTDNVGLFFGEDIFIAFGAVLLIQSFFTEHGLTLDPLHIALWGIPTAICAFVIHCIRVLRFERAMVRRLAQQRAAETAALADQARDA
ncbi:DUF969 domain-containing protein [Lysobacter enzymogenes]|uniref:DUF969 domain-containing protein n=1 Tax=Lysobacter enzymogenes TaxID=69 RepID=UPI00374A36EC